MNSTRKKESQEEFRLPEDMTPEESKEYIARLMQENAELKQEVEYLESRLKVFVDEELPEELQGLEILQMQELRSKINEVMRSVTEGKHYLLCARRTIKAILRPLDEGLEPSDPIVWQRFQSNPNHVFEDICSTGQSAYLSHRGIIVALDKAPLEKLPLSAKRTEKIRRDSRIRQRKKRKKQKNPEA